MMDEVSSSTVMKRGEVKMNQRSANEMCFTSECVFMISDDTEWVKLKWVKWKWVNEVETFQLTFVLILQT